MRRALTAGCFFLALAALVGCDQKEAKTSTSADTGPGGASLDAPAPAVFGQKAQPLWQAGPEPAASASPTVKAAAYAAVPDSGNGDQTGRQVFDGSKPLTAYVPPGVRATTDGRPSIVLANHKMAIDTDGRIADANQARTIKAQDRYHTNDTSLHYANGAPLDPTHVPYIVLPLSYSGARMGDLALVEYKGRKIWAVCGDRGPDGKFGEASPVVAQALGINPNGGNGGIEGGVTYTLFPGSGTRRPQSEAALLASIQSQSQS